MAELTIVNYPFSDRSPERAEHKGKFVQLSLRGREYLLFASFDLHSYHNQICAHFLADQGIAHRWIDEERLEFDCPGLTIFGGGRFLLNTDDKTLKLWDHSQAYGRFDERGLKEKIAAAGHPWSGCTVDIV